MTVDSTTPQTEQRTVVPVEGVVDWQQLRAVVTLNLKQGFRGSQKSASGKRAQPILQLIVSMGFMGIFFAATARRCDDLATYLTLLFTTAFAIVALSVLPDTLDGRRRNVEVLSSKPIAATTLLAARAFSLLFISTIIIGSFTIAPLVSATWAFGCSWILAGGLLLLLILGSFAVVVMSLTTVILASQWFNIDRLRIFAQYLLVGINLGIIGLSLLSMSDFASRSANSRLSLTSIPSVKLLPSAWFADFLISNFGVVANLERAGVLLLLGGALLIATRFDLGKRYPNLIDTLLEPDNRPASAPLTVSVLDATSRIPLLGSWLVPRQPLAVATLILTATHREVMSRLKILAPRIVLIAVFIASLTLKDRFVSPLLLAFYGFLALMTGCDLVKQSAQPEASWPLLAAPVGGREIIRGMRLVILLKYFALPGILVPIAVFLGNPPILAALLVMCYLFETRCIISLMIVIGPALPLSREHVTTGAFAGIGMSMVVGIVTSIGYLSIAWTHHVFASAGLIIGVIGLFVLIVASYLLDRAAETRISNLQYEF